MLQINVGDIGARVAAGLDIQGRVPVGLDETAVPTAQLVDLTDSLFAQNPATVAGMLALTGAAAAQLAVLQNLSPRIVVKVDRVVLQDQSTVLSAVNTGLYLIRNQADLSGGLGSFQGFCAVLNQPAQGVVAGQAKASAGAAAVPAGAVQLYAIRRGLQQLIILELGWVLYPGDALLVALPVSVATDAVDITYNTREFTAA